MRLLLTRPILKRLRRELHRAGSHEIGGLLLGEHVSENEFRVIDISVQGTGGSIASFVRDPASHDAQLKSFFARTKSDFTRFNYLGEWHSHPMFDVTPSQTDCHSMQSIVDSTDVGANFVVLLVVKLVSRTKIEGTATIFRPRLPAMDVVVSTEDIGLVSFLQRAVPPRLKRWFRQ